MSASEKLNILLVDDQPSKLLTYEVILQDLGQNLLKACSGAEALEILFKQEVAVVLVDVCMPQLDGFELAEMIRGHPRCEKIAIIFISGIHLSDADLRRGFEMGAVDYVPVPVVPEVLRAKVKVFAELYRKTRQLEAMNRILENRVASLIETSEDAIITKDLNGIVTSWNKGAERIFGYEASEMIGKPINLLIPPDRPDEVPSILERLRKGQRIEHYETVRRRKDGTLIDISLSVSPIADSTGKIVGASKIGRDITARRQAQEAQTLLLGEMRHRINNLFAVTSSLVTLSARASKTPTEMEAAIRERLAALSRAQQLTRPGLIQQESEFSNRLTLKGLIDAIFAPYAAAGSKSPERIVVSGCDQEINDSAVTSVALLLHELATNAAKYGALSTSTGIIHIDCSSLDDWLVITWEERGGPHIKGPPNKEGFGGGLARKIVANQFSGRFSNEWNPGGLKIKIEMPLAHLNPAKVEQSPIGAAPVA